jgi:leucyl-tRNA synthetase
MGDVRHFQSRSEPEAPAREPRLPHRYTARLANEIEEKWQARWERDRIFTMPNPGEANFDARKPKFYVLDMFPYPSGTGLHVGHPEGYTATDIVARYKRMKGFNVLHPMGWDAFGLPAEQYAVQTNVHPAITTKDAIDTFRRQLKRFGFSYDWSREFATIDPDYYKWTQWIWLKAYRAWYDPWQQRARPIDALIQDLENGRLYVDPSGELVNPGVEGKIEALGGAPVGMRKWHELSADETREIIDSQRLAYLDEQTVNWCPKLGTVLANEEVIDGKSERGGYPVFRMPLKQWMFRITAYAERLLRDLEPLDWPISTKTMQKEWIGRSEGAEILFEISDFKSEIADSIRVFTTRPDTLFGATYMVLAPEHPLIDEVLSANMRGSETDGFDRKELEDYVRWARNRSDVERQESKDKTGVFTGLHAINPATRKPVPVWTADYVLMGYGHGAIMAVPAHDQRDFEFARKFDLPIVKVVEPAYPDSGPWDSIDPRAWARAFEGEGTSVNSENDEVSLNGVSTPDAKDKIIHWLHMAGRGERKINYKLRDWLFSRQRYWGEPFPIVFDEAGNHYPVDEANLPVRLPQLADFKPIESDSPQPPLAKVRDWVNTTAGEAGVDPAVLPPSTQVTRETNTMPNWAGSCWYYLRFCDPGNSARFVDERAERYWMSGASGAKAHGSPSVGFGVDLYIGGSEHAVLHLLYARFWHKILFDLGYVSTPEPMGRLFHQGLILSHAYQRADGSLIALDEVEERGEGAFFERATGAAVKQIVAKMSKSLKNVVNPDDVIAEYGADTFRLYEMCMGPLEASKPWNTRDIAGPYRFLQRAWRLAVDEESGEVASRGQGSESEGVNRALHRTIQKVGDDIERLAFNTAIAAMMEFVNIATAAGGLSRDQIDRFVRILAPFAPHMAEELWSRLGHVNSITFAPWPEVDAAMLIEDEVEIPVQIMGKVKARVRVPAGADEKTMESIALGDAKVKESLGGKTVRKVIVVQGRIINIVVS